jgi:hypothetical protein
MRLYRKPFCPIANGGRGPSVSIFILELNLDAILQKTNNSTPVNTITMPPSTCTSTRYETTSDQPDWDLCALQYQYI